MTEKDVYRLKDRIDRIKSQISELKGENQAFFKQLKEFDCLTLEDLEKKLKIQTRELQRLDGKLQEGMQDLEKKISGLEQEQE